MTGPANQSATPQPGVGVAVKVDVGVVVMPVVVPTRQATSIAVEDHMEISGWSTCVGVIEGRNVNLGNSPVAIATDHEVIGGFIIVDIERAFIVLRIDTATACIVVLIVQNDIGTGGF